MPLLHQLALRAADAQPDAIALSMDDERIAYGELERLAGALAARLVAEGCQPGDRVCLLTPKQPLAVVAMQAVLTAGCVYVPLDADSPAARLARIVSSAEPALLLADPSTAALLDELAAAATLPPVVSLAHEPVVGERVRSRATRAEWEAAGSAPDLALSPDAPAYLLFTSGSTGEPKGVLITHRNVTAFAAWAVDHFGVRASDRLSGHPPLHFDLSTLDLWTTFAAGAELVMVPPRLGLDAHGLARLIRERELTQWCSVPSVLSWMAKFDAVGDGDFPALERLLWCGEVLPTPVLAHWMRRLPQVRFTNLYGPTETTVREQLVRRAGTARGRARLDPDRRRQRRRGAARARRAAAPGRDRRGRRAVHRRRRRSAPATGVTRPRRRRRSSPTRATRTAPRGSTAPATSAAATRPASSTSSAAPTRRSRAAATASSSARSNVR